MANLTSSGQISLDDIIKNRTGAAGTNVSLKDESETFASGSTVDGSSDQTTARRNLEIAPYALSEFYDSDFNTDIISSITVTTAGGGSDTDSVDGEDLTIGFVTDGSETGTYTVQFLNSGGSVIGNTTTTVSSGTNGSVTFSSLNVDAATYRARVKKGFATQDDDATFTHHDAIGAVSITDPSDTTLANTSATHDITHARSINNTTSLNDYNWTFAKSSGDGSNPNPTSATTSTPTVRYTGPGIYTADLRVDGTPSQARNSTTATQVSHRIDYTKQITIDNPGNQNQGTNYNITGNHKGYSSGIEIDEILASNNSVLRSNDDSADSRVIASNGNYSQTITPSTSGGDNTISVKAKAHGGGVSAESSAYNIFPLLTTSKNTINPTSQTIFATRNNTDTSSFPTTFTFSSPGTRTDNITSRTYSEQADSSNIMSLTGDTTPSSQTGTQPGVQASANVGTATIRYTVQGDSSQTTFTDCALTVNYSMEVTPTGLNEGTNNGFNEQLGVQYTVQGFTATRIDGELYDTDDLSTKVGSTAIFENGISQGALQTLSGTITTNINPATDFSIGTPAAADGEDGFKIKLIGKDSGGTIRATAFTDAFALLPQASTTINTQTLLGAEIGYNSLLNAADTTPEGSNTTDTVHLIGTIVNNKTLFTSATLATAYDGDPLNDDTRHFYSDSNNCFIINDSGVVSSLTSRTPSTPASIAVTSGSTTDDTWDIAVTGNTTVARTVRIYYGTSQGSTSNNTTQAAASQGTSVTSTKSGLDVSALAGQDIYISARFENNDKNGSQLSPADKYAVPGNVSFGSWSGGPSNLSTIGNVGANATDETTSGNSHIISITNNTGGNITISGEFVSGTPSAADGELHYEMAIGSAPSAGSYNRNTVIISNGATSSVYVRFELTQTKPDASSSGNAAFRVVSSGGFGNSAQISVSYSFSGGG